MSKELQKDDFILPGDLGSVSVNGVNQKITEVFKSKTGFTQVTINPPPKKIIITSTIADKRNDLGNGWMDGYKDFKQLWQDTEDAEFEEVKPKQLPNASQ